MFARSTVFAGFLLLAAAAPAAAGSPYSALYSFGDSLSDAGNVFIATGGLVSALGYQPAPPYSGGSFSNGPVWTQVLSSALGLGTLGPSLAGGNDYAFGGATTGFTPTLDPTTPVPTLAQQVGIFSSKLGGKAPSNALYTFSIGANDLLDILSSGVDAATALTYAAGAAQAEADAAKALLAEGARRLVVFDVPDLGLTPGFRAAGAAASAGATALALFYNQQLFSDLAPVEAAGLTVYDLDTFGLIGKVAANPKAYGFTDATSACYSPPNPASPYTGGGVACPKPDDYLFWDHIHPTAAAQAYIGTHAAFAAAPEPSTWAMMLAGFGALGLAGWRRRRAPAAV
ncbi:SGNH/GDSL hydrolase family protein [uncultured Rhodoblastus sp.]|uniref:SGNH/GDSL hydrolase family protein n=1 Tax=uncultured Rhodoblastus sp. TaxID=543037 RepID=UPI0025F92763|nr:SGNH/GDSL hydrolase family protein [uncultured Rhodoblastus sp.]